MIILFAISRKIIKDITKIGQYLSEKEAQHNLLKPNSNGIQSNSEGSSMSIVQQPVLFSEEERIDILTKVKKECLFTNPQWLKLPIAVYPWFSGFFSGLLALTAKWGIMLMVHITEGDNAKYFTPYLMLLLKPVLTIGEIYCLNLGLRLFDTCYVMPIFKASVVFHHMLCGGVLLQEFFLFSTLGIVMFIIGMIICIGGILIMLVPHETPENTLITQEEVFEEEMLLHLDENKALKA